MQLIGTLLPAVALLLLAQIDMSKGRAEANLGAAFILVTVAMTAHAAQASGVLALLHDIAGPRAAELFTIANMIHKLAGVIAPHIIRYISSGFGWDTVFLFTAAHYAVAAATLVPLLGQMDEVRVRLFGGKSKQ